ncbi:hypothetical protein WDW37_14865 [Bdellovibrionota bacterium FG-1]
MKATALRDLKTAIDAARDHKLIPRTRANEFRRALERALADWNQITTPPSDLPASQRRNWAPSPAEMTQFLTHELSPIMERFKLPLSKNLTQLTQDRKKPPLAAHQSILIRTPAQKNEIEFARTVIEENLKALEAKIPADQRATYLSKKQALLSHFEQLVKPTHDTPPATHSQIEKLLKEDLLPLMTSHQP